MAFATVVCDQFCCAFLHSCDDNWFVHRYTDVCVCVCVCVCVSTGETVCSTTVFHALKEGKNIPAKNTCLRCNCVRMAVKTVQAQPPWLFCFVSQVDGMRKQVNPADPYACPMAEEWDSVSFEKFVKECCYTQGNLLKLLHLIKRNVYFWYVLGQLWEMHELHPWNMT